MNKKTLIKKIIDSYDPLKSQLQNRHKETCGRFSPQDFDEYWEGLLSEATAAELESHCLDCHSCLSRLAQAYELHELSEAQAASIQDDKLISSVQKTIEQYSGSKKQPLLWAAAPASQGSQGEAYGVAVATENGETNLIECNAWVGKEERTEGRLELWGMQIEGTQEFRVTRPLTYLEDKLEGIFRVNPLLRQFHLDRRYINIDLKERILQEAGSLTLSILMAVLNALFQCKDEGFTVYSADLRQDGKLERVGAIAEKIRGAQKAGATRIILPMENAEDLPRRLEPNLKSKIRFMDSLEELLSDSGFIQSTDDKESCQADVYTPKPAQQKQPEDRRDDANHAIETDFIVKQATSQQFSPERLTELLGFLEDLCQSRGLEERQRLIIFSGDPLTINNCLPSNGFEFMHKPHILNMESKLQELMPLLGGGEYAIITDHDGYMDSLRSVAAPYAPGSCQSQLIFGENDKFANLSKPTRAMIFFFPASGRHIHVFDNGHMIGKYLNGKWRQTPYMQLESCLKECSEKYFIDWHVLKKTCQAAIMLAENKFGGSFIFSENWTHLSGKWEDLLESKIGIKAVPVSAEQLQITELMARGAQEGAVLIDHRGNIISTGAFFDPEALGIKRHSFGINLRMAIARAVSSRVSGFALLASRYGTVTVYDQGNKIFCV
ncbi:MAG: S16 family serine protease [Bacteroidota bacterium]